MILMDQKEFEEILNTACQKLTDEARNLLFQSSKEFENRVREVIQKIVGASSIINFDPNPQAFPDIAVGQFGIEVKFTTNDAWRSVANSVLETNRIKEVKKIYLIFGKMGGISEVRWGEYDKCVMHVRTSHVPRFEVDISAEHSLFEKMGIPYDEFRSLPMEKRCPIFEGMLEVD